MSCGCSQETNSINTDFQYAVKIVCGELRENPKMSYPLAAGQYFTAVNVHNPARCDSIIFRWKVAIGLPGLKVGKVTEFSEAKLGPDEALEIDCKDILKKLSQSSFAKGWVVIETDSELDIVAVYSASKELNGKVETFHTERVKPRCLQKCGDFGLDISTGVAAWQLKPPGSSSFTTAALTQPNQGWAVIPNSLWVSVPNGANSAPIGQYLYQLPFYLCSGFKNPVLNMKLLSDYDAVVSLNGHQIGTSSGSPYTSSASISTNNFFKAGLNILTVTVNNGGRERNPAGLDIQGFIDVDNALCAGKPMPLLSCPSICYRVHVKDGLFNNSGGWLDTVCNGATAGTTGENRRMEAFQIWLNNAPPGTTIEYRGHLKDTDWTAWTPEGQECGSTYENRRMEAVEIRLVNAPLKCHVKYRVHMKNKGWSDWAYDGATAGTTGQNRRIEAIEIIIE